MQSTHLFPELVDLNLLEDPKKRVEDGLEDQVRPLTLLPSSKMQRRGTKS